MHAPNLQSLKLLRRVMRSVRRKNMPDYPQTTRFDVGLKSAAILIKYVLSRGACILVYMVVVHGLLFFSAAYTAGSAWASPWHSPNSGLIGPLTLLSLNPVVWVASFGNVPSNLLLPLGITWIVLFSFGVPTLLYIAKMKIRIGSP